MRQAGTLQSRTRGPRFGLIALGMCALGLGSVPAFAQDMKPESIKVIMDYAWGLTPQQFTKPDGSVVQINKLKREEVMIPLDVASEVIKVGRLSAYAQACDLKEDQVLNYHSLMQREDQKKKWTPQQMIYINQLHLTTVMLLTGKLKVMAKETTKEGGKDVEKDVVIEEKAPKVQSCPDDQKQKVKDLILAYVKTGPELKKAAVVAPAPAAPAMAAEVPLAPAAAPAVPKK